MHCQDDRHAIGEEVSLDGRRLEAALGHRADELDRLLGRLGDLISHPPIASGGDRRPAKPARLGLDPGRHTPGVVDQQRGPPPRHAPTDSTGVQETATLGAFGRALDVDLESAPEEGLVTGPATEHPHVDVRAPVGLAPGPTPSEDDRDCAAVGEPARERVEDDPAPELVGDGRRRVERPPPTGGGEPGSLAHAHPLTLGGSEGTPPVKPSDPEGAAGRPGGRSHRN